MAHRHLHPAPWLPHPHLLTLWRVIGSFFLLWLSLSTFTLSDLAYFTYWGVYFSTFATLLLLVHEFRVFYHKHHYTDKDWSSDCSLMCLWKWSVFLFELAFTFQNIIVPFFWIVLNP